MPKVAKKFDTYMLTKEVPDSPNGTGITKKNIEHIRVQWDYELEDTTRVDIHRFRIQTNYEKYHNNKVSQGVRKRNGLYETAQKLRYKKKKENDNENMTTTDDTTTTTTKIGSTVAVAEEPSSTSSLLSLKKNTSASAAVGTTTTSTTMTDNNDNDTVGGVSTSPDDGIDAGSPQPSTTSYHCPPIVGTRVAPTNRADSTSFSSDSSKEKEKSNNNGDNNNNNNNIATSSLQSLLLRRSEEEDEEGEAEEEDRLQNEERLRKQREQRKKRNNKKTPEQIEEEAIEKSIYDKERLLNRTSEKIEQDVRYNHNRWINAPEELKERKRKTAREFSKQKSKRINPHNNNDVVDVDISNINTSTSNSNNDNDNATTPPPPLTQKEHNNMEATTTGSPPPPPPPPPLGKAIIQTTHKDENDDEVVVVEEPAKTPFPSALSTATTSTSTSTATATTSTATSTASSTSSATATATSTSLIIDLTIDDDPDNDVVGGSLVPARAVESKGRPKMIRTKRQMLPFNRRKMQDEEADNNNDVVGGSRASSKLRTMNVMMKSPTAEELKAESIVIDDVNDHDILMGSRKSNKHPGNKVYRDIVRKYQPLLEKETIGDRAIVVSMVIDHIHDQIGGRFLKVNSANQWHVVPRLDVITKITKALVELGNPSILRLALPKSVPTSTMLESIGESIGQSIVGQDNKRPKRRCTLPKVIEEQVDDEPMEKKFTKTTTMRGRSSRIEDEKITKIDDDDAESNKNDDNNDDHHHLRMVATVVEEEEENGFSSIPTTAAAAVMTNANSTADADSIIPTSWKDWVSRVNNLVESSPSCMDYSPDSEKYKILLDYIPMEDIVSQIRYKHMMYQIFISDRPGDRECIHAFPNQISFNSIEKKYNKQISNGKSVKKKRSQLQMKTANDKYRSKKRRKTDASDAFRTTVGSIQEEQAARATTITTGIVLEEKNNEYLELFTAAAAAADTTTATATATATKEVACEEIKRALSNAGIAAVAKQNDTNASVITQTQKEYTRLPPHPPSAARNNNNNDNNNNNNDNNSTKHQQQEQQKSMTASTRGQDEETNATPVSNQYPIAITATVDTTSQLKPQTKPLSHMQGAYSSSREKVLANIKELRSQISQATFDEEKKAFEQAFKLEIESLGRLNKDEMKSKLLFEGDKIDVIEEAELVNGSNASNPTTNNVNLLYPPYNQFGMEMMANDFGCGGSANIGVIGGISHGFGASGNLGAPYSASFYAQQQMYQYPVVHPHQIVYQHPYFQQNHHEHQAIAVTNTARTADPFIVINPAIPDGSSDKNKREQNENENRGGCTAVTADIATHSLPLSEEHTVVQQDIAQDDSIISDAVDGKNTTGSDGNADANFNANTKPTATTKGKWTPEEHEEVAKAMAKYGPRVSGKQISIEFVKGRTPLQLNGYINRKKSELLATCKKYKQDYCDESEDDDDGGTIRGLKIHQTRSCDRDGDDKTTTNTDVEKNGQYRNAERELRRTKDGCLLPKGGKEKYLKDDGTYRRPDGARPFGLSWHRIRGLWVPSERLEDNDEDSYDDNINKSGYTNYSSGDTIAKATSSNCEQSYDRSALPRGLKTHIRDPAGGCYWTPLGSRRKLTAKEAPRKSKKRKPGRQSAGAKTKEKETRALAYVTPLEILQGKKPTPSNLFLSLHSVIPEAAMNENFKDDDDDDDHDEGYESWTSGSWCLLQAQRDASASAVEESEAKKSAPEEEEQQVRKCKSIAAEAKAKERERIGATCTGNQKDESANCGDDSSQDSSKRRRLSICEQSRIINPVQKINVQRKKKKSFLKAKQDARDYMLAKYGQANEEEEIVMV